MEADYNKFYILLYGIAWLFTNFEPLQDWLDNLLLKKPTNKIKINLNTILTCQKCFTFWLFLIITLNPLVTLTAAMIAQIHSKIIDY
jgi:hypothetical protein